MNKLKSFLLGGSLILNSICAFGYDFISGPLAYDIVSVKDKTAMPVQLVEEAEILEVPYTVMYDDIQFSVPEIKHIYPISSEVRNSVKEVIVEEGISILNDTFQDYSSLEAITLPSTITRLGATFRNCIALKSFVVPPSVEYITGALFSDCSSLSDVKFEGQPQFTYIGATGTTHITSDIFRNCVSLTSIILPTSIQSIGAGWFNGCVNLKEVVIPDNCISLGDHCFEGCRSLTSFTFPASLIKIGYNTFRNSGLTGNIIIPNKVMSIEGFAFSNCVGIDNFTFPDNCLLSVGDRCLLGCEGLKSITIPNNGAEFKGVLTDCSTLEEIISLNIFPPSVISTASSSFVPNSVFLNAQLKIRKGAISYYSEDDGWGNFLHVEEVYEQLPITSLDYEFIVPASYLSLLDIYYPVQHFEVMEGNSLPINLNYSSVGFPAWEDFKPYYNGASLGLESVIEITHITIGENHEYCTKVFITPPINSPAVFSLVYKSAGVEELIDDSLDTNQPVEIYDFNGKRVLTDFHNLSSGIYIIKQGKVVKKVMIQ